MRIIATLFLVTLLAGCKLHIIVPVGGTVITASGIYTCLAGQVCEIDVVDLLFDETFTAVPDGGYLFDRWKKRSDGRGFCAPSSTRFSPCRLYTSFYSNFPALLAFLDTEDVFYLEPVFILDADALQYFTDNISEAIVHDLCIDCHVAGGDADFSGLIFVAKSQANHLTINHQAFIDLGKALGDDDLSDYVTGMATDQIFHDGGVQMQPGSQEVQDLETYANMLE
ncbi:MAG: hypothetical protein HOC23_06420 [Halieaceae bacterium]|jgi:hypothetical protein|nr:hypothetical protein [Halieaceae bacterium]